MFGRPSHIETNYIDANQIVEPGRSDKAAFDPEAYHKAMREGRNEGTLHYLVAFLAGAIVGIVGLFGSSAPARALGALVLGVVFVGCLHYLRWSKLKKTSAQAVELHAQTHELQVKANQLEIERAKSSGAFDRWNKSQ